MHMARWMMTGAFAALVVLGCGGAPETTPAPDAPPADAAAETMAPPVPESPVAVAEAVTDAAPLAGVKTATIARDEWGVPHIHADTETAAAYALGYAMAEDRLEDLCKNILVATGRAASVFGMDYIETDVAMNLVQNDARCRAYFEEHDNEVTALCHALMQGVRRYAAENPEALPEWAPELEDHHPMAIGRVMILQWPLGTIMSDYGRREGPPDFGSNGWAVMPHRTAEGAAILSSDPHMTWNHIEIFYEARVTGGDLVQNGFFLLGVPLLAIGHNNYVGYACTTGGPDTSDVFAMRINEDMQYEFDGEWYDPVREPFTVEVKGLGPLPLERITTRHGFLIPDLQGGNPDRENGVAYVGRSPYFDDMGLVEQMYRMVRAKNIHEFYDALAMNHFMEQNLIFADREGNIGYVRVGRTPIRPEGHDWSRPVPGHTSETDWQGLHPIEDLVQIINPEQGYLQNNNISPANMMIDSPMTADRYPDYIFNVSWDENNPRGRRGLALLSENDAITVEDAIAITMDVYDYWAPHWMQALEAMAEAAGPEALAEGSTLADAIALLRDWDGHYDIDSRGAVLMKAWRLAARGAVNIAAITDQDTLTPDDLAGLSDALEEAAAEITERHGALDIPWGEAYLIGRGGQFAPGPGADYGSRGDMSLTETLLNLEFDDLNDGSGRRVAKGGSGSPFLMILRPEGIESYTVVPWGQAGSPDSPHYMDQGEQLYSHRAMKRNWFAVEDWQERLGPGTVLEIRE